MDIDGLATIRDSRLVGNNGTANAPAGTASAGGGAIANFGQTTLERTVVTGQQPERDRRRRLRARRRDQNESLRRRRP